MPVAIVWVGLLFAAIAGCSKDSAPGPSDLPAEDRAMAWPKDWSEHLGKNVTLEGTAANAKLGALLEGDRGAIWIDGLDRWPDGFYLGQGKAKHLRVRGTVIKRDDLPVFVQKPGELPKAGIPVQSEGELEKAKSRFLLQNAKWTVLE
jgi:hypothetical protein